MGKCPSGEVVVDEPARVGVLTAPAAQRLFPGGERTVEPDRDTRQRDGDRGEMQRGEVGPAGHEQHPDREESEVGEVAHHDEVSDPPIDHSCDPTAAPPHASTTPAAS